MVRGAPGGGGDATSPPVTRWWRAGLDRAGTSDPAVRGCRRRRHGCGLPSPLEAASVVVLTLRPASRCAGTARAAMLGIPLFVRRSGGWSSTGSAPTRWCLCRGQLHCAGIGERIAERDGIRHGEAARDRRRRTRAAPRLCGCARPPRHRAGAPGRARAGQPRGPVAAAGASRVTSQRHRPAHGPLTRTSLREAATPPAPAVGAGFGPAGRFAHWVRTARHCRAPELPGGCPPPFPRAGWWRCTATPRPPRSPSMPSAAVGGGRTGPPSGARGTAAGRPRAARGVARGAHPVGEARRRAEAGADGQHGGVGGRAQGVAGVGRGARVGAA